MAKFIDLLPDLVSGKIIKCNSTCAGGRKSNIHLSHDGYMQFSNSIDEFDFFIFNVNDFIRNDWEVVK